MFDFDGLSDMDSPGDGGGPAEYPAGGGPAEFPAASLRAVWWLNLARRPDRRARHEAALRAAGLTSLAERIEAVDGRDLDLHALDSGVVEPRAAAEEFDPPLRVVGVHMTRGVIGLMLSWHGLLRRIAQEDSGEGGCYLVAEDDAVYCEGFLAKLKAALEELGAYDPQWEALQVGYLDEEHEAAPVVAGAGEDARELRHIMRPVWACGTAGILVHGARGARRLLELLFPARPSQQLDTALSSKYEKLRMYMSREPLMFAEDKLGKADRDAQGVPAALHEGKDGGKALKSEPEKAAGEPPNPEVEQVPRPSQTCGRRKWEFQCRFLDLRTCIGLRSAFVVPPVEVASKSSSSSARP